MYASIQSIYCREIKFANLLISYVALKFDNLLLSALNIKLLSVRAWHESNYEFDSSSITFLSYFSSLLIVYEGNTCETECSASSSSSSCSSPSVAKCSTSSSSSKKSKTKKQRSISDSGDSDEEEDQDFSDGEEVIKRIKSGNNNLSCFKAIDFILQYCMLLKK